VQNQRKREVAERAKAQLRRKVAQKQCWLDHRMEKAADNRTSELQKKMTVAKRSQIQKMEAASASPACHQPSAMMVFGTRVMKTAAAKTCADKVREQNTRKHALAARVRQDLDAARAMEKQALKQQQERAAANYKELMEKKRMRATNHSLVVRSKARSCREFHAASAAATGSRISGQSLHQEALRSTSLALRTLRAKQHNEAVGRKLQQRRLQSWTLLPCCPSEDEDSYEEDAPPMPMPEVEAPSKMFQTAQPMSDMVLVANTTQGLAFDVKINKAAESYGFKSPGQMRLEAYGNMKTLLPCTSEVQPSSLRRTVYQDRADKAHRMNVQKLAVTELARLGQAQILAIKKSILQVRQEKASSVRKVQWMIYEHKTLLPQKFRTRLVKAKLARRQQRLQVDYMNFENILGQELLEERAAKALVQNQRKREVAERAKAQLRRKVAQKQCWLDHRMEKAADNRTSELQKKMTVAKRSQIQKMEAASASPACHQPSAMMVFGTRVMKTAAAKTCADKVREQNTRKHALAARVRQDLDAARAMEKQALKQQQERAAANYKELMEKKRMRATNHSLVVRSKARSCREFHAASAAATGSRISGQSLHQEALRSTSLALRTLRAKQHNEAVGRKLQQRLLQSWTLVLDCPSDNEALSEIVQIAESTQGLAFQVTINASEGLHGFKTAAQRRLEAYSTKQEQKPFEPSARQHWQLVNFSGRCQELDVLSSNTRDAAVPHGSGYLASRDRAEKARMLNEQKLEVAKQVRLQLVKLLVVKRCNLEFRLQKAAENRAQLHKARRVQDMKENVVSLLLPRSCEALAKVQEQKLLLEEQAMHLAEQQSRNRSRMEKAAEMHELEMLQRRHSAISHIHKVRNKLFECQRRKLSSATRLKLLLVSKRLQYDALHTFQMAQRSQFAKQHNMAVLSKMQRSKEIDFQPQPSMPDMEWMQDQQRCSKVLAYQLRAEKARVLNLQKLEVAERVQQQLNHVLAEKQIRLQQRMQKAEEQHQAQLMHTRTASKRSRAGKTDSNSSGSSWISRLFSFFGDNRV